MIGNTNYQKLEILSKEFERQRLLEDIGKRLKEKAREKKNGSAVKE